MGDDQGQGFRASPVQRFLTTVPDGPATWVQATAVLEGPLDEGRLSKALHAVWDRHEALRTRLVWRAGLSEPVQVIDSSDSFTIDDVALGPVDRASALDRMREQERSRVDVRRHGVRVVRAHAGHGTCALVVTGAAAVVDEQSLRVVLADVLTAYRGTGWSQEPVQYPDVAVWQHEVLTDEDRRPARSGWEAILRQEQSSELPGILLPGAETGSWRRLERVYDVQLGATMDRLTALTGHERPLLGAAAWLAVQSLLLGEDGVVAGVAVSGREPDELADAVGPFAREVPLLLEAAEGTSVRQYLDEVRDAWARAAAAADDLDPIQRTGPLAATVSLAEEQPTPVGAGAVVRQLRLESRGVAPVHVRAGAGGIVLDHDVRRLPPPAADALLDRVFQVLSRLVADIDAPLNRLSLLLPGEGDAPMRCGPPPALPQVHTFHEAVVAQGCRTPNAVAVDDGLRSLTYAELARRVEEVAAQLAAVGVLPGSAVVLSMRRRCELLVGLLGIMRCGAAYVPVDVDMPVARLRSVLSDVAAEVLLCGPDPEEDRAAELDGVPVVTLLRIDAGAVLPADGTTPAPIDGQTEARTAYVLYTSGSTSVPNGVPVSHQALLNYLTWAAAAYHLKDGRGSVVHSPIGFDLSLTGLLAPLLVGQRVRLVAASGVQGLLDALDDEVDVSLLKVTPSQLPALLNSVGAAGICARIRTLVVGGEPLHGDAIAPFLGVGLRVVNEYGPTETVVACTAFEVGPTVGSGPVPIGDPVAGFAVHLRDPSGRPVPRGGAGELVVVSGVQVGRGYLNRPHETARRFVADPGGSDAPAYRTGDRVRWLADNTLVHLGRLDDQLKVLGTRVEPGEVEAVLRTHPAVAEATVVGLAPAGASAPTRLGAQVVLVSGSSVTGAALRAHCREQLPPALIPAMITPVAHLPLTRNGKRDRAAVRAALERAQVHVDHVEPRDRLEAVLCTAVAQVLRRPRVGIDDNYFALGGDSIRSVMIASRAAAEGVPLAVADLHRHPTVRALAAELSSRPAPVAAPVIAPFGLVDEEDRQLMPDEVEDAFPLSLLQQGMIFHRNFAAKSAVYHAIASVRLQAPLDMAIMREVIHHLVARHPMLRTSFDQRTFSRPLQLVHRTFQDPLGYEDLSAVDPHDHQRHIDEWVRSEKLRGFELDAHPLIRFMVHRLDAQTFQFTYGFHHEIVDGWSEALMVTELFGHYFSLIFGEPWVPAPPASSMRDSVALELEALRRPEDLAFWNDYLDGASLMRLPRLGAPIGADTGTRDIVRIAVDVGADLSAGLKALAASRAMPLKNVLLAAHMAVMHHYHGHPDTLSYTVTNGRPEEVDGSSAIGLFVNSLALRLQMGGGSWADLIADTLDAERRTMPYRRLPMAELKRHQGSEPLAETLFFFTDYHVFRALDRWLDRGVRHEASELYGESTFPFCAIFRTNRKSGQLEVRIEFDALQFPAEFMDRVAACYRTVLDRMVADPDVAYDAEPLLGEEEWHQVVDQFNGPSDALGADTTMHQLIREQAARTPDRVAVASDAGRLTYAGLVRAADRLSVQLRAAGAGPERTVALLGGPTPDTVVAVLGVLTSGAAYVPLDDTQPSARLTAVIAATRPVAILAPAGAEVPDLSVPRLAPVDFALQSAADAVGSATAAVVSPDSAAYIIFTSGSTGTAKGVVVSHRNVLSSTLARDRVYPSVPEHFLLLSSLAVDSSVAGLFWTLARGGTLHLPAPGGHRDPAELARLVADRGITHTLAVPALLSALLVRRDDGWARSLRHVIAAGDVAPRRLQEELAAVAPTCTLHNEYGPTETSVWATHFAADAANPRTALPIGTPVPGARAYPLDRRLHPVPLGVTAELYVGGAGVARGYLDGPGRTAAVFLPDPNADRPCGRMYRTGDLVRQSVDKGLEFLGRDDYQVKIRGYRVELSEVEAVLEQPTQVQQAVVVARTDAAGWARLHAYVVPAPGAAPDEATLLRHVRERLPASMVPADVTVLAAMPLTRVGKLNRAALPASTRTPTPGEWLSPTGPTEEMIAAIWCRVLDVERVGAADDFFARGGESLRAMHVINRVNVAFGLELSVRTMFDAPSLRDFAALVDRELRAAADRPGAPPVRAVLR